MINISEISGRLWPLDHPREQIPVEGIRPTEPGENNTPLTKAAVLVPIIPRSGDATVLFTLRSSHLSSHAGQVSFPGGRLEPGDASAVEGALRETEEEVGIAPGLVRPIGLLNFFDTISNYRVLPVVGVIHRTASFQLDGNEVEAVFEVPWSRLMNPAEYQRHTVMRAGERHHYHSLQHQGFTIWGATAAMLLSMAQRFRS